VHVKSLDKAEVIITSNEKTDVNSTNVQISSQVAVPNDALCVVTAVSSTGKVTTTNTASVAISCSVTREINSGAGDNILNTACIGSGSTDAVADPTSSVHSNNSRAANLKTEDNTAQDTDSCDGNIENRINNVLTITMPCANIPSSDYLLNVSSSQPTCCSTPKSDHRQQHKAGGSGRHVKNNSEFPTAEIVYVYHDIKRICNPTMSNHQCAVYFE
jgi:hypothetical protein